MKITLHILYQKKKYVFLLFLFSGKKTEKKEGRTSDKLLKF